jgi:hypothetical protein
VRTRLAHNVELELAHDTIITTANSAVADGSAVNVQDGQHRVRYYATRAAHGTDRFR